MGNALRKDLDSASERTAIEVLAQDVSEFTGVVLEEQQRSMIQTRISKRLLELGMHSIQDYVVHYQKNKKEELQFLVSLLTTHHTYFFREYSHFEYLEKTGLPNAVASARAEGRKKIRIWSAACSRGQECYSLSMFLAHTLPKIAPDFTYEIYGTDVDPESVAIAKNGVFPFDDIKAIPIHFLGNHWAKGTGAISHFAKAKASIKDKCTFDVGNLLQVPQFERSKKFDIIFCRNVFIYFKPAQIKASCKALIENLNPNGIFIIGLSESLNGMDLPVTAAGPSIYTTAQIKKDTVAATVTTIAAAPKPDAPLRVLCIDDSGTILTLLKGILKPDFGFNVVGVAKNGLEASEFLKSNKVDVVTCDIHMPEQDGLTFLQKNFKPGHPPVVMISSVSRDDSELAMQCLKAGASDFVEKPSVSNMAEKADEIRLKVKLSAQNKTTASTSFDQQFAKPVAIQDIQSKVRFVFAPTSSSKKLGGLIKGLTGSQPATVIMVEGIGNAEISIAQLIEQSSGVPVQILSEHNPDLTPGKIYLADSRVLNSLKLKYQSYNASILIYGDLTENTLQKLKGWNKKQIILEENSNPGNSAAKKHANDIMPSTSFAYMSNLYFSKG